MYKSVSTNITAVYVMYKSVSTNITVVYVYVPICKH